MSNAKQPGSQLRTEIGGEFSAVLGAIAQGRAEMVAINERTLARMRMRCDEVVDRIALMSEGKQSQPRRRQKR